MMPEFDVDTTKTYAYEVRYAMVFKQFHFYIN